jgi:phenylacetate-CoA ligase
MSPADPREPAGRGTPAGSSGSKGSSRSKGSGRPAGRGGPERRINDARFELASPEAIRAVQQRKLQALVHFVWATNPFYREHWRAGGVQLDRDTDSLEAFAAGVPWVQKGDFLADQAAHPPYGRRFEHALSLGERLDFYTTSGTSGQGTEAHAQTVRELAEMERVYAYGFRWAGLAPGDGVALTLPITMLAGGRVEMQGAIGAGMTVYPLGSYDAQRKLELIEQLRPRALYGSSTYFGHLGAVAGEDAFESIEVLLCGLEGVGFSYFHQLEQRFGARAFDRFGCAQMRSDFMFTCEHGIGSAERPGVLHNIDPYVLLEVIDPETGRHVGDGEFGELVVTSLYHLDNPLVRCRLRDGGVYRAPGSCSCGRPFAGVELASIGRVDDVKKVKGVNIYPQAVDDLLYSFAEVEEYRVLLRSSAELADLATVQIMTRAPLPEDEREGFAHTVAGALRERVGIGFAVELSAELPRSEYKARRWHDERSGR